DWSGILESGGALDGHGAAGGAEPKDVVVPHHAAHFDELLIGETPEDRFGDFDRELHHAGQHLDGAGAAQIDVPHRDIEEEVLGNVDIFEDARDGWPEALSGCRQGWTHRVGLITQLPVPTFVPAYGAISADRSA